MQGPYPQGPAQIITQWTIGNPAAGAQFTQTIPTGKMWKILGFKVDFTASAVAGNRTFRFAFKDSAGKIFWVCDSEKTVTISGAAFFSIGNAGFAPTVVAGANESLVPCPSLCIPSGGQITSLVQGMDGGDQWTLGGFNAEEYLMP